MAQLATPKLNIPYCIVQFRDYSLKLRETTYFGTPTTSNN